eukprot:UN23247
MAQNPGISMGEVGKILGEAWKNVDETLKAKYQRLADQAKESRKTAVKEYENSEKAQTYQKLREEF